MTSKITCPCGISVNHNYYRIHVYSKNHIEYITTNPIKDFSEMFNEELIDNLNEKMMELDENKCQMTEGDYLKECDKLQKDFNETKRNSHRISYETLIKRFRDNNRLYNKIISEITYKNNKILLYQRNNNVYFIYYLINDELIIVKIDYIRYMLNTLSHF